MHPMATAPDRLTGLVGLAPFAALWQRFEDLIASANLMTVYFIHSRRWRENHDAAIKAFLARSGTSMEVFLPDLENHELMFSLARHFDDGPQIPGLVTDAYRYFTRLAREFGQPSQVWLFNKYPTYSFYTFDDRAIIALYANTAAKKDLPAFEVITDSYLGRFLLKDTEDLRSECRRCAAQDLEVVIQDSIGT